MIRLDLDLVSIDMILLLHCINNTVITIGTVFYYGGAVELLSVTMLRDVITLIFSPMSTFHLPIVLATVEFVITIFDPRGKFDFCCNYYLWNIVCIRCLLKVTTATL
ncbi:hypothetical protein L195_g003752 [Trifolium pratense]|uniref:Uncharacterized protein n=1 Tax=Trifolium pratense TaxID=57577 RepID=A0A2K3NW49_TRIPR|nr:hypothetical protein L195_g003752 [Trifolium pratense]